MEKLLREHGPRLFRFGIVGLSNTIIDLGVLNLLLYFFSTQDTHAMLFPVFATLSFISATANSFHWNRKWTFKSEGMDTTKAISRFYAVTIVSFCINVGISSLLVWINPFPALSTTLWANLAKLIATAIALGLNFLGYEKLVFKK